MSFNEDLTKDDLDAAASKHAEDTVSVQTKLRHTLERRREHLEQKDLPRRAGIDPGDLRDDVHASEPSEHDEDSRRVQKKLNNTLECEHERSEQDGENSPHRAPEDPDDAGSVECLRNI